MKTFKQYLILVEDKSQKTLDWIKTHADHGGFTSRKKIGNHDDSMYGVLDRHARSDWHSIDIRTGQQNRTKGYNKETGAVEHLATPIPVHHDVVDHIATLDPDPNKSHTETLHKWWVKGQFKMEDHPRIKETMGEFLANKKHLGNITTKNGGKASNLSSHESIHELEGHLDKLLRPNQKRGEFHHPEAPLIHDQDGLRVNRLDTKAASIATRKCFPNRWCTSRNDDANLHYQYAKDSPLYHVQTPDGNHWQFHFASGSFADHTDRMHDPEHLVKKYPGLKSVQEFKNQPHGSLQHKLLFANGREEKHRAIDRHLEATQNLENPHNSLDVHHVAEHGSDEHLDKVIWGKSHKGEARVDRDVTRFSPMSQTHALLASPATKERHLHAMMDSIEDELGHEKESTRYANNIFANRLLPNSILDRLYPNSKLKSA